MLEILCYICVITLPSRTLFWLTVSITAPSSLTLDDLFLPHIALPCPSVHKPDKAPSSFGPPHRALHYLYLPLLGKPPDSMHPDSQLDHNQLTPPFGWYLVTCVDRVHLYVTRRLHGALSLAIQQIRPCFTSQWIEQAT